MSDDRRRPLRDDELARSDWLVGYHELGRSDLTDDLARDRMESFVRAALREL